MKFKHICIRINLRLLHKHLNWKYYSGSVTIIKSVITKAIITHERHIHIKTKPINIYKNVKKLILMYINSMNSASIVCLYTIKLQRTSVCSNALLYTHVILQL